MLEIMDIQPYFVVKVKVGTSADLRHPRDAGPDGEHLALDRLVEGDLLREMRTRAHERHPSYEHEEELRQLVEGIFSEESSHGGHARILLELEQRGAFAQIAMSLEEGRVEPVLVRVTHHRAELEIVEQPPASPHAHGLLPAGKAREEHAPRALDEQRDRAHEVQRRREDEQDEGDDDVERALVDGAPAVERSLLHLDDRYASERMDDAFAHRGGKEVGRVPESEMFHLRESQDLKRRPPAPPPVGQA